MFQVELPWQWGNPICGQYHEQLMKHCAALNAYPVGCAAGTPEDPESIVCLPNPPFFYYGSAAQRPSGLEDTRPPKHLNIRRTHVIRVLP